MCTMPLWARRFLLKQPERVIAGVLLLFVAGTALVIYLTHDAAREHAWSPPSHGVTLGGDVGAANPSDRTLTADAALAANNPSLRASAGSSAEESATLKALSAIEQRLTSLDSRLAATEHAAVPAFAAHVAPDVRTLPVSAVASENQQMATQVAALSQTVAAVLSLVASEHQHQPVPAPQPPPAMVAAPAPPAPPRIESSWEQNQKLEEIKRDVQKHAEDAAKAQIEPEIAKLKKTIQRLSSQETNRYTQVLQDLTKLSPITKQVSAGWTKKDQGKDVVAPTLSQEQSTGHGCRSPPCSRDIESCKYNDNCCADRMYEMLSDFSDFLNSRNVTHFVVAGTLIGAVRDKDIIPYTSDVDVMIPKEGWERAKEINFIKGRKRSYYFMQDPQESHCGRLCAVWEGLPVNRASFTNSFDWDTDKVATDIAYYMDIYDENMDFAKKLAHLHYPLSNVTIRNRTFPAPREQELWVEARYGASWRTPDHQSHFGANPYPTLDEAKQWSESMLMLRKARTDAVLGHRLLERASVDHKSGHIVVQDAGQEMQAPDVEAKRVTIEGLQVSREGSVTNGTVVIWPPDTNEGQITHYVLFWAAERVKGWDLALEHLGKQIASVSRCSTSGDPFKACATRGVPLYTLLPLNGKIPPEATHLVVVASNEAGDSSKSQGAALYDDRPGGSDALFTRRAMLGILGGMASDSPKLASCVSGGSAAVTQTGLLKRSELEERAISLMLKKTPSDMQAALRVLAEWMQPVVTMLRACERHEPAAKAAHKALIRALSHLVWPKSFVYTPGKVLDIDGTTIFLGINHAIGELRKDKPANFGTALGELLKPLGVAREEKAYETPEDMYYHAPDDDHVAEDGGLVTLGSGIKYLLTSVKTAHDAHIALFQSEVAVGVVPDNTSVLYEFAIGGSANRLCAIRFGRSGKNEAEAHLEKDALDDEHFRDFWFSVDSATGRVAMGRGHNINANVVINMTDAPPGVRGSPVSFAVMTHESAGAWRFPKVDQEALATTTPASPSSTAALTKERLSLHAMEKPAGASQPSIRPPLVETDASNLRLPTDSLRPPPDAKEEHGWREPGSRKRLHLASPPIGIR